MTRICPRCAGDHEPDAHDRPLVSSERKVDQYLRQSERAAAEIETWPKWMQRNLDPPTDGLSTEALARALREAFIDGHRDGEAWDTRAAAIIAHLRKAS